MDKPITSRSDPESRRAYTRWHYQNNKEYYKKRARAHDTKTRKLVKELILSFLLEHPCVDCGEADPIVLEFDHRPDENKLFNIGAATSLSMGLASVRDEIAKCEVRCANCHRRITYKRAGRTHRG
jgi:hypothetical protein